MKQVLKRILFAMAMFYATAAQLWAGIVYDESVLGDPGSTVVNLGTLSFPQNDIIGELDGGDATHPGSDEGDYFNFSTVADWTLDVTMSNPQGTTGYALFLYDLTSSSLVNATTVSQPGIDDLFGTISAGTYKFNIVPIGNNGQVDYSLSINVDSAVPEPTSMALFGLGSLGIGVIGRRRKKQTLATT